MKSVAVSSAALVDLGARYEALGLPAAARAVFERARRLEPARALPALRLAEHCLASGDAQGAREAAASAVRAAGDPASRVTLARAELLAGEVAAARRAAAVALEQVSGPDERARAHAARAEVAAAEGDEPGARVHAVAALEAHCELAARAAPDAAEAALPLAEAAGIRAVELGAADEAQAVLAEHASRSPSAALVAAAVLTARQARGDDVRDAEVEAQLRAALDRRPGSRAGRLRLAERKLRRRARDGGARREAETLVAALAAELERDPAAPSRDRARAWILAARAQAEDPATAADAEEAYRAGLRHLPGYAEARGELAEICLARGDVEAAAAQLSRALRVDPDHALAWRKAVGLVVGRLPPRGADPRAVAVSGLLEAADPGLGGAAGVIAGHLAMATAEVARTEVLEGVHTRGHRLKNQLGVLGARARSARKLARGEVADKLAALEREASAVYDEWAAYLRSTQAIGMAIEPVAVAALLSDVAAAVPAEVELSIEPGLPDVRGDRLLLEEAIRNLVVNGLEACPGGGVVTLAAAARAAGGARIVEIVVADRGGGIAQSDLPRVVSPGYTTKDGGSGIGLSVAERAVAAHHGRLSIDSEVGAGTRVTIALPCDLSELGMPRSGAGHLGRGAT